MLDNTNNSGGGYFSVSIHFAHRSQAPHAHLITSAPMSPDEEFYRRRRRYAILMGTRAICIVAAVLTYRVSLVLALGLVAGGAILPWCAVIIANGRLLDRRRRSPARLPGPVGSRGLPTAGDPERPGDRRRLPD